MPFQDFSETFDVPWAIAETGVTDAYVQRDDQWIQQTYRQMVKHGGVSPGLLQLPPQQHVELDAAGPEGAGLRRRSGSQLLADAAPAPRPLGRARARVGPVGSQPERRRAPSVGPNFGERWRTPGRV